jgi:hypothetical protein
MSYKAQGILCGEWLLTANSEQRTANNSNNSNGGNGE